MHHTQLLMSLDRQKSAAASGAPPGNPPGIKVSRAAVVYNLAVRGERAGGRGFTL